MSIKLGEYKSFLHFIKERTPELKELTIELNYGDEFSVNEILGEYFIDVEECLDEETDKLTKRYFSDKLNQDIYWLESYYNEYFALLHEVGHILSRNKWNGLAESYKDLKSKVYNSKYEAFKSYRSIEAEQIADNFAIEFTNKYFYEIGKYFTGMDKTEIDNFLGVF